MFIGIYYNIYFHVNCIVRPWKLVSNNLTSNIKNKNTNSYTHTYKVNNDVTLRGGHYEHWAKEFIISNTYE